MATCKVVVSLLVACRKSALPAAPLFELVASRCQRRGNTCIVTCFGLRSYTSGTRPVNRNTFGNSQVTGINKLIRHDKAKVIFKVYFLIK